jgi:hypothetical protein
MCTANGHVRFTPNSDRKNGHATMAMSALPPKADMCGATSDVRFLGQKRTCAVQLAMSAFWAKSGHCGGLRFKEPQIECREDQDNSDVHHQPRPELNLPRNPGQQAATCAH